MAASAMPSFGVAEKVELAAMRFADSSRHMQGTAEARIVQRREACDTPADAEPFDGDVETPLYQFRPYAFAFHPRAERRVVILAAAHVLDAVHHALRAIGKMRLQPLPEQRADFPWQAQHDEAGADDAGFGDGGEDAFEIGFGDEGNHRRDADADRNAGVG